MVLATVVSLASCAIVPVGPQARYPVQANYPSYPVYEQGPPQEQPVYVNVAPPPQQYEVVPALPFLGALWIAGVWHWSGNRHVWYGGHYVRPVAGYRYVPYQWYNHGGRWAPRGGHWVR